MSARHLETVRKRLAAYADRGVFRNFREVGTKGAKTVFVFNWLERRPLIFIYDDARKTFQFKNCLPRTDEDLAKQLRKYIRGRSDRGVPAHRRIDPSRAEAKLVRRAGDASLVVQIKRNQVAYGVSRLLHLVIVAILTTGVALRLGSAALRPVLQEIKRNLRRKRYVDETAAAAFDGDAVDSSSSTP